MRPRRFASAPGSAATWTATPRPGPRPCARLPNGRASSRGSSSCADVRALAVAWGMSSTVAGPVPELDTEADEPYRAFLTGIWERLARRRLSHGRRARRGPRADRRGPSRAPRRRDRRRRARRPADARRRVRPPPRLARPARPRVRGPRPRAAARRRPRGRRLGRSAASASAPIGRLVLSMTSSAEDVLAAERLVADAGCRLRVVPLLETIDDLRARPRARRGAARPEPARRARGDGRLLGLGEGRRRARGAVGDPHRAGGARRRSPPTRGRRADVLPRPRRQHRARRRPDARLDPRPAGRRGRGPAPAHRAGRDDLLQVRPARPGRAQPRGGRRRDAAHVVARTDAHVGSPDARRARADGVDGGDLASARTASLVWEDDELPAFFRCFTPVDELALLEIGSRPASRPDAPGPRRARRAPRDPLGLRLDAEPLPAPRLVRLRHGARGGDRRRVARRAPPLYRDWPFFRSFVENLEMALAKSSIEIARGYLRLVPDRPDARPAVGH